MLNPNTILDAVTAEYRAITAIVQLVRNDANNINAYHGDRAGERVLQAAIYAMAPGPGVLVTYQGFGPKGTRGGEVWSHRIRVYAIGSNELPWQFVEAIASSGNKLLNHEFLSALGSMDVPMCNRQSLQTGESIHDAIDYWVFDMALSEKGSAD